MSKKKPSYIKIPNPNWSWWQMGLVAVMIIIACKSEIKIESLIKLIQTIKS